MAGKAALLARGKRPFDTSVLFVPTESTCRSGACNAPLSRALCSSLSIADFAPAQAKPLLNREFLRFPAPQHGCGAWIVEPLRVKRNNPIPECRNLTNFSLCLFQAELFHSGTVQASDRYHCLASLDMLLVAANSQTLWPWVKIQIVPPVNIPIPTKIKPNMGGALNPQNGIPKRF